MSAEKFGIFFFKLSQKRHPEWLTCLWQVKDGMNMGKRCLQSRPRGPSAKRQPSPEGLGIQRQPVERRRCGTTLFVCSLGEQLTCLLQVRRFRRFVVIKQTGLELCAER